MLYKIKAWLETCTIRKIEELYVISVFIWRHFKDIGLNLEFQQCYKDSILFSDKQTQEKQQYENLKVYEIKSGQNLCGVHHSEVLCVTQGSSLCKAERKIKIPFVFNQFELGLGS